MFMLCFVGRKRQRWEKLPLLVPPGLAAAFVSSLLALRVYGLLEMGHLKEVSTGQCADTCITDSCTIQQGPTDTGVAVP